MAICLKCGNRKVKRPNGRRRCKRCGPLPTCRSLKEKKKDAA